MEKRNRIFVAFPLNDFGSDKFFQFKEENKASTGLKWTRQINLHITLYFIGETNPTDLEGVLNVFADYKKSFPAFSLEFKRYILKGKINKPRMLWTEFKKSDSFSESTKQLKSLFSPYMLASTAHKDPIPHCTLARIKGTNEIVKLNLTTEIFPKIIQINHPELWQTTHDDEGVLYKRLS